MVSIDMPSSVFPCSTRRGRGSSLPSCPASTAASIHEQEQQQDRALGIGVAFTNLLHARPRSKLNNSYEKTVEKCVCSRTELNKCTQCMHGRRTQTNTVQCAA